VLKAPLEVKKGHVIIRDEPGSGVAWDEKAVKKYLAR
jgi:L-alanine-DL-glutamate epimerase-like enolase superfamily enzyme